MLKNFLESFEIARAASNARVLASRHEHALALNELLKAYQVRNLLAPSALMPLEFNLSLAAMALSANRYSLSEDALSIVEAQIAKESGYSDADRQYIITYVNCLKEALSGASWNDALRNSSAEVARSLKNIKQHLKKNFPLS